ncbi:MAG TPA: 4Fe-4S dicluster domain-containing protein [Chloroflexi bacterium]|nr:4Fe-4S dicluster domain-containing protein [Chloroflexota bacterium]
MKRILVQPAICSGCRACEIACVARHDGRFGVAAARIRVTKVERLGVDHPHVCRQCRRAPCAAACPADALYRDAATGAILLRPEDCIGCGTCVDACPFGMAALHPETGLAIICDLCGGDPACVKRCATGALMYADAGAGARAKRERLAMEAMEAAERGRADG